MKRKLLDNYFYIYCILIIFLGIVFRIWTLAHNNFTGDELNTVKYLKNFYSPLPDFYNFYSFLLSQPRGPLQNIITFFTFIIIPIRNEFIVRLPFSIFSVLSIFLFYLQVKEIFSKKVAIIATAVFSMNGLMIIFGQVAQYQSVVIFCILLSIYLYHTGVKSMEYRFFIFSGVIFGIGLLAHLDILGSVFFFLGYFLFELKNKKFIKFKIFSNFLFFLSATAVSSLFYVFYFFSHFDEKKQDYLQNRVFGSGFMPQTPYMNLGKILTLYMPDFYWIILFCFCVLSLALLFSKYKSKDKNMNKLFILVLFLFTFAFMFSFFPIKPRLSSLLIYLSSFLLILFSFFSRIKSVIFALIFYFLFSFSIYFYFMKDPRTHVYICLLPAFILFSYGIYFFIEHKSKFIKATSQVFFILYFTFLSLVGYLMFFDKNSEYPWNRKNLIGYNLRYIDRTSVDGKISGVFGFGGSRHWLEIRELLDSDCLRGSLGTNENKSVLLFYLDSPLTPLSTVSSPDNYIFIFSPNSWSNFSEKMLQSEQEYMLLKSYYVGNKPVTKIYGKKYIYKNQDLKCFLSTK